MIVDKYQLYAFWKVLKKMWEAKHFNTMLFKNFFDSDLEEYMINLFINDNHHTEYMSNYGINLVNEFNCNIFDVYHWAMYTIVKAIKENVFPEFKDVNSFNKLKRFTIFTRRNTINQQISYINKIVEERNSGLGELTDERFSLYDLNTEQVNEAYKMFRNNEIDPEFYIRGLESKKFDIDTSVIKDAEYLRFITFSKIIIKLNKEYTDKNSAKKINQ